MKYLATILALFSVLILSGCDSGGPDPKVESKRMDGALQLKQIFDSVSGDYDKLTAAQREEVIKLFNGSEDNAKRMWAYMKQGGLAGPTGGASGATTGPPMQGGAPR
jgi:hypothetical protein